MKKRLKKVVWIILIYHLLSLLAAFWPELLVGEKCLPAHLKKKVHQDYTLPSTQWIPFRFTAWCLREPPIMLLGNQTRQRPAKNQQSGTAPIPEPGTWQFSVVQVRKNWPFFLPYFAFTTRSHWHFRIGCRWDDIDHYFVFPSIALHRL